MTSQEFLETPGSKPFSSQNFARENIQYSKQWFQRLQQESAAGEPLAYVHVNVPLEIFHAMGINVVVNQWWSSIVGSQRKTLRYKKMLKERGYRDNMCDYCSSGLASLLETDPGEAPWGGLPRPTVIVSGKYCDGVSKVFDIFSKEFGIPHFDMDPVVNPRSLSDVVSSLGQTWKAEFDPIQISAVVEQYRSLISFLELHTGRTLDYTKLHQIVALTEEHEGYYHETRELMRTSRPTPLNIADQLPATVIPQWHRGTIWGRDRAKLFLENTQAIAKAGTGACPDEKYRLMWLGLGLWQNMGFYRAVQEEMGAVFSWNEYLALGADGYLVKDHGDPLETVVARMVNVMTVVANDQWYVNEVINAALDGVVTMGMGSPVEGGACRARPSMSVMMMKQAGIPVCEIDGDPINPERFDEEATKAVIRRFLTEEVDPWIQAGRPIKTGS